MDDDTAQHPSTNTDQTATISLTEDYFPPPLPLSLLDNSSTLLSIQSIRSSTSSRASSPGLQAKPTTAISLPEGVYAQQQDAIGTTSITGAPSFSDSTSVQSLVPTLSAGDNDVESMLGEILEEGESGFMAARWASRLGKVDDVEFEDEGWDESNDEEDLSEGEFVLMQHWRADLIQRVGNRRAGGEVEG